jgi:spore coat polysaccharide biosynthesis protein SpsF
MKIGFLITARLKSSRLSYKLLLDLNGKTMVERVIERAKLVVSPNSVVLCTSLNEQDYPLEVIAKRNGIQCFRGSEPDVLQRLCDAADLYGFDYIINITGENPLFSIEMAEVAKSRLTETKADFLHIKGLPIGCAVYGLRVDALRVVCKIKEEVDTEIWGYLINRPEIFRIESIDVPEQLKLEDVRITSDYPQDFEFISQLFYHFKEEEIPSYSAIKELLDKNPKLLQINRMCKQADVDSAMRDRINDFFVLNKERILRLKEEIYN